MRISVEQVKAAYAATGKKPCRRKYISTTNPNLCCPLTAVFFNAGGTLTTAAVNGIRYAILEQLGISDHYLFGFTQAVDGYSADIDGSDDSFPGYLDGLAVAAAIFGGWE